MRKQRNRPHHHGHADRRAGLLQLPRFVFNPRGLPYYVLPKGWIPKPDVRASFASRIGLLYVIGLSVLALVGVLLALGLLFGGW